MGDHCLSAFQINMYIFFSLHLLLVLFDYRGIALTKLLKLVSMFLDSLGATEWVFRPKRLLPEVFMQRIIFRELCRMELGLTSILSELFLPWRNSPYVETDVRRKYFLHINNAGKMRTLL